MPRRHDNLFAGIARFQVLYAAARRAIRGKRKKPGAAAFFANLEGELLALERQLLAGIYRPGRYVAFAVNDPKKRIVSAAPFRDRVVHHALCGVVEPIFEAGFIGHSFANRTGKGTHSAVEVYERYRDRHTHVLRCDIYRYFPAIDHAILKSEFRRRIACASTLALLDLIVDGSNPQEPVQLYFDGDDLFEPFRHRRGLPIGNLTSQFFANLYLDGFDHFVTEVLRAPYVRYVDDFALFADNPAMLLNWRSQIERYLVGRRLKLHPRKTFVAPCREPAQFLGFVLCRDGHRRLPDDNVRRFRNRLRGLRDQWRTGAIDLDSVDARVRGWIAHAEHADTWRLRHAIFKGGRFDPAITLDAWTAPCRRVLRGGSWNNTPDNLRSANRNRNTTDNRNNNIGFRVGRTLSARAGAITVAPGARQASRAVHDEHGRDPPSQPSPARGEERRAAPDTTAALVLAHSWGDRRRRYRVCSDRFVVPNVAPYSARDCCRNFWVPACAGTSG